MTAATPGQAAWSAHDRARGATGSAHTWSFVDPKERKIWEGIAQAAIDAATEGTIRACGYTLADVGRFLESEAAAREPHAADGGRSFEDMLADPREQFDPHSELLASISEYAAAPPASAGIKPWHPHGVPQPAPGLADAMSALTTEMHAEADRIASPNCRRADATELARAQALHEYAARIRQLLGPEAP